MSIAAGVVFTALCSLLFVSCDESLPPRDDPQNVLVLSCTMDYYLARYEESVYITIKVTNTYTEVFSDTTAVYGTIVFIWKDDPSFQKHVDLTAADLKQSYFNTKTGQNVFSRAEYNAASKILTIPVGQSAVFQYRWNFISDDLTDIRKSVKYTPDPANPNILRTNELPFIVNAGIHLYKKLPMLYLQPFVAAPRFLIVVG